MIRAEYPHLLHEEPGWEKRARGLAAKTFELSEFLARSDWLSLLRRSPTDIADSRITYHDSCHMCRLLGLRDEPRRALEKSGLEITEMAEPDRCCGFGGAFSVKLPEVSAAMTREKLRQAAETGAEMLVTADPGCLVQMRRFAAEAGVRVEHLAVVLEEQTR
jgi:L-lactate dehydrogenase complex protein LldE